MTPIAEICDRIREELSARLDGEAPSPAAEGHVKTCEGCRRYEAELAGLERALAATREPSAAELARSRARVLKAVYGDPIPFTLSEGRGTSPKSKGWWERLAAIFRQPAFAVGTAFAIAMIGITATGPSVQIALAPRPAATQGGAALAVAPTAADSRARGFTEVDAGPGALVMRLDSGSKDETPVIWVVSAENNE